MTRAGAGGIVTDVPHQHLRTWLSPPWGTRLPPASFLSPLGSDVGVLRTDPGCGERRSLLYCGLRTPTPMYRDRGPGGQGRGELGSEEARKDEISCVRSQLRHRFRPFLAHFPALHTTHPHQRCSIRALRKARAYRMLIGALAIRTLSVVNWLSHCVTLRVVAMGGC